MVLLVSKYILLEKMFIPKKFKFKKCQKGRCIARIKPVKIFKLQNTVFLKALSFGKMNSNQFKALKLVIGKKIKKRGRLNFRTFPQTPITKKPLEVRMGKGKGPVDHWVAKIKPGSIICYIETNAPSIAIKALEYARIRLPIKTRVI